MIRMHKILFIILNIINMYLPLPDALGRTAICALLASNGMQEEQMFQISM